MAKERKKMNGGRKNLRSGSLKNTRLQKKAELWEKMKIAAGYSKLPQPGSVIQNNGTANIGGGLSGSNGLSGNYQNSSLNYIPQGLGTAYDPMQTLVLFYGFNGMLANKYSLMEGMNHNEIVARMQIAGNKVPYKIMTYNEFNTVRHLMDNLEEIAFDDALNIIRIGIEPAKVEEFEEPEVDEFDDDCVETCKPGEHKCGK